MALLLYKFHALGGCGFEPFALGKVRSTNFFSAKGLCRVLFIRILWQNKKKLPSAWGGTRQNIFGRARRPLTVILPSARPSTRQKKIYIFFKNYFAECPNPGTRQSFFFIFFKKVLCRVPLPRHSAKFFYFFKKITLPSAPAQALGKVFF